MADQENKDFEFEVGKPYETKHGLVLRCTKIEKDPKGDLVTLQAPPKKDGRRRDVKGVNYTSRAKAQKGWVKPTDKMWTYEFKVGEYYISNEGELLFCEKRLSDVRVVLRPEPGEDGETKVAVNVHTVKDKKHYQPDYTGCA